MAPTTDNSRLPRRSTEKKQQKLAHGTTRSIQTRGRAIRGREGGSNKENQAEKIGLRFEPE